MQVLVNKPPGYRRTRGYTQTNGEDFMETVQRGFGESAGMRKASCL